jgi:hypothetical protein
MTPNELVKRFSAFRSRSSPRKDESDRRRLSELHRRPVVEVLKQLHPQSFHDLRVAEDHYRHRAHEEPVYRSVLEEPLVECFRVLVLCELWEISHKGTKAGPCS